ncbi:unnamed protein product [Rotaria sordida]|uniref:Uncharacterized protein n=2 Tax=Rotaria sordida TaxID=392033 RepID=A0A819IJ31_9BILA|nr:unnamed protein product [Rotaria sordida]
MQAVKEFANQLQPNDLALFYFAGHAKSIKCENFLMLLDGSSSDPRSNYSGPIPVLIADQDMHEMTVAIALQGFRVSQLNPADSHCVFGEYWQNHGPAVEEC